jgi:hypothetical protein
MQAVLIKVDLPLLKKQKQNKIVLEFLAGIKRQEEEIKGIQMGKKNLNYYYYFS